jgi:hypothetical protein
MNIGSSKTNLSSVIHTNEKGQHYVFKSYSKLLVYFFFEEFNFHYHFFHKFTRKTQTLAKPALLMQ